MWLRRIEGATAEPVLLGPGPLEWLDPCHISGAAGRMIVMIRALDDATSFHDLFATHPRLTTWSWRPTERA
jgi:hypothetical protein